ncbi:MAG: maltose/maltodextrin ABC transporter substrate-binding protein MalE [Verrucomicrobia bacterium]|nr:maltose/maltodextrin ABC transporter substrate-binding protein MalE [Verrucomicrobiota bacterium]
MLRHLLRALFVFVLSGALPAFAWTDGELLVWVNGDKGYNGLGELGKRFEQDLGIKVTVEHPDNLTDKFQSAAATGKGPDILMWAHDRIGEWADSGLLKPLVIADDDKRKFIPKVWEAVSHNQQIYGYPLALECVSLIYNKKHVTGPPPAQLAGFVGFAKELKRKDPNVIPIMWDYSTPYFSWPFLASAGAYPFKKTASGYDTHDVGIDTPGAVRALTEIIELINGGILPKGTSYSVMEQSMNRGDLAMMLSGPWSWANLRKGGIDFGLAPVPGVDGNPGRPFVGLWTAMINRASPNSDLASQFLEKYLVTDDGLKTVNADVPIGVPALQSTYNELAAKDPLVRMTYENAQNGEVMPNIPQMGKFWSSLAAALQIATNGQASPQVALAEAKKNMEK